MFEFDKLPKRARWVNVVLFPVKIVQVYMYYIYLHLKCLVWKKTLRFHTLKEKKQWPGNSSWPLGWFFVTFWKGSVTNPTAQRSGIKRSRLESPGSIPGIPTTIKIMGVNITTIDYLRVLIIEIVSTNILMVVEAQGYHPLNLLHWSLQKKFSKSSQHLNGNTEILHQLMDMFIPLFTRFYHHPNGGWEWDWDFCTINSTPWHKKTVNTRGYITDLAKLSYFHLISGIPIDFPEIAGISHFPSLNATF